MYQLKKESIRRFAGKGGKYVFARRKNVYLLPFPTREPERVKFENGFLSVTGAFVRMIKGKSAEIDLKSQSFDDVLRLGKFDDDESKQLFEYYLEESNHDVTSQRIDKIEQLERVPLSENEREQVGEIDFARYLYDTYARENRTVLHDHFQTTEEMDIITTVLMEQLSPVARYDQGEETYRSLFPGLEERFQEDVAHMRRNPKFLIENLSALLVHYAFTSITQTIFKVNKIGHFEAHHLQPLYFLLRWEKGAKWRENYESGYRLIKYGLEHFYAHEHALNILSMNDFIGHDKNRLYHDYFEFFAEKPEGRQPFISSIYEWLEEEYATWTKQDVPHNLEGKTLRDAFEDLHRTIRMGVSKELNSRYPKTLEMLVKQFYRKNGGSLGTLLSLSQEQLLMLVAVSVKEERIELRELWKRLEERGVWFDYNSKEEVVKLLDKLNYLEKKSDSGDAQYVKSIL
ncbi:MULTISPECIES: DNA phosphorothioation-dependent restriction protein DptG [unclassified Exiguobacterium]|jgi:DNA phosphorothioation-dependent restriction protein DptG|uniref:DNA phosphorothioation-dependent restriction protein DptG n=1 Tax=unclassified Exiguobacterium TaxID=2644629 RepID=UPI0006F4C831|nr:MULTISPECIES: DNA phosphorothioation-dependent restriction protein DptG [unclassified Exiguobacterium]KQS37703.1 hypothetical protein ASG02_12055 [Exiguobacterium sp. Leaf196]